jgi:hypothetical protein
MRLSRAVAIPAASFSRIPPLLLTRRLVTVRRRARYAAGGGGGGFGGLGGGGFGGWGGGMRATHSRLWPPSGGGVRPDHPTPMGRPRCDLHDAADYHAVGDHVVIIVDTRGPIGRKVLFGNLLIPSLACQREPTITDKERSPPITARRRPATLP